MRGASVVKIVKNGMAYAICAGIMFFTSSCVPTYPKEKLPEMIKEVFRIEYSMNVDVSVEGSTLGIYYPMQGLMDENFGISKDSWDKISNLILVASRVVLSTDADIKFYCVITQDEKLPEIQVIIIKYVDDVKLGMYQSISRDESFKRTLFSVNLTPQAKKERTVEKIFDKLGLEEKARETVLDEFFRSSPTKLSDIGYWRDHFYLKDITLGEFLAAEIANRIKLDFREGKDLSAMFVYKFSEGYYVSGKEKKYFLVQFNIEDSKNASLKDMRKRKATEIVEIANEVLSGYKFQDFNYLELDDQLASVRMRVEKEKVYNFDKRKMKIEQIVEAPANYF
ncbi:MAG TPA: hypothetical protein PKY78_06700 [Candidatus Omnitrophota bacterium]|nr:hypothetical protein [Candidatus Omnitrophota bacterium]HPS20657.1 hypothetical protein [Candidatus Omnitrophota bacterium]